MTSRSRATCRRGQRVHERFSVDEVDHSYEALLMSAANGSSRRRLHQTTRWSTP